MKKIIAIMLGLLTLAFISNSPRSSKETVSISPQPNVDEFIFGAIQSYNDHSNNYSNYNAIGLSGMHTYDGNGYTYSMGRHTPKTSIGTGDSLTAEYNNYSGAITTAMQNLATYGSGSIIWSRPMIE